jgi:hypothetical protein
MKIYKINELKPIAISNGYKLAALEDANGKRLVPFNKPNVKLEVQFKAFEKKLASELQPNGLYYILLATQLNASKYADKFAVAKGKVNPEEINEQANSNRNNQTILHVKAEEVLSYDQAFKYIQEIAELKNEVAILKLENQNLQTQLDEVELDEDEEKGNNNPNNIISYLKDTAPLLIGLADKYFEQQDKRLLLEEKKLNLQNIAKRNLKPVIKIGSQEHLDLIEKLFNENKDDLMNIELDKLEAFDTTIYNNVVQALGLDSEEEEEEEPQQ